MRIGLEGCLGFACDLGIRSIWGERFFKDLGSILRFLVYFFGVSLSATLF